MTLQHYFLNGSETLNTFKDVIGRQVRMHGGFYPGMNSNKPPFELPVVYEDDHFAVGESRIWIVQTEGMVSNLTV